MRECGEVDGVRAGLGAGVVRAVRCGDVVDVAEVRGGVGGLREGGVAVVASHNESTVDAGDVLVQVALALERAEAAQTVVRLVVDMNSLVSAKLARVDLLAARSTRLLPVDLARLAEVLHADVLEHAGRLEQLAAHVALDPRPVHGPLVATQSV